MIEARCFTNLDKFKQTQWPTKFAAIPRIGDSVEGKGCGTDEYGHRFDSKLRPKLKVTQVTFTEDNKGNPLVEIELWYPPYMNAKGELVMDRPRKVSEMDAEHLQRVIRDAILFAQPVRDPGEREGVFR